MTDTKTAPTPPLHFEWRVLCTAVISKARTAMDTGSTVRAMSHDGVWVAHHPRVLIAEDDPDLHRFLVTVFDQDGYIVDEVKTGFDLLARASRPHSRDQELDLIISDIRMPGLTGLEVLAGLRSPHRPGGWNTPVILITAFGDEETHAEAKRLGAAIFDKPFDIDDLRACAINMVSRAQVESTRERDDDEILSGRGRE